jgi:hypothetical protein
VFYVSEIQALISLSIVTRRPASSFRFARASKPSCISDVRTVFDRSQTGWEYAAQDDERDSNRSGSCSETSVVLAARGHGMMVLGYRVSSFRPPPLTTDCPCPVPVSAATRLLRAKGLLSLSSPSTSLHTPLTLSLLLFPSMQPASIRPWDLVTSLKSIPSLPPLIQPVSFLI